MRGTYYEGMLKTDQVVISLAHSPDSDDLVMWWPLTGVRNPDGSAIEGDLGRAQVDTGRFRFELVARDVEELNQLVVGAEDVYDITAISCAAYPAIKDRYAITACGGSFGEGYGPRVVARADSGFKKLSDLVGSGARVAVPGVNTSAFMALNMAVGKFEYEAMLFSEIPEAVARGEFDAGLLIHEAQLTFAELGLKKIGDMGEWWRADMGDGMALPLGLNVVARSLDERFGRGTVKEIAGILKKSVACSIAMGDASRLHLQLNKGDRTEWDDPELVDEYLAMYVSDFTADMMDGGWSAVSAFLDRGHEEGLCGDPGDLILADEWEMR